MWEGSDCLKSRGPQTLGSWHGEGGHTLGGLALGWTCHSAEELGCDMGNREPPGLTRGEVGAGGHLGKLLWEEGGRSQWKGRGVGHRQARAEDPTLP